MWGGGGEGHCESKLHFRGINEMWECGPQRPGHMSSLNEFSDCIDLNIMTLLKIHGKHIYMGGKKNLIKTSISKPSSLKLIAALHIDIRSRNYWIKWSDFYFPSKDDVEPLFINLHFLSILCKTKLVKLSSVVRLTFFFTKESSLTICNVQGLRVGIQMGAWQDQQIFNFETFWRVINDGKFIDCAEQTTTNMVTCIK